MVEHKELEKLVKQAYKKQLPIFVWGNTGIGKSDTVRKVAKDLAKELKLAYNEDTKDIDNEKNFSVVDVRISQFEPSDLRGIPHIVKSKGIENEHTVWITPNWLPKKSKGILFFDELNLAPPSIQASAYQLILDRKLGDYELPSGWVVVSAGNRLEDRANVFEMSAPLQNRFLHSELDIPSATSEGNWQEWAVSNNIDHRIIAFLQFKPSLLFKFDIKNKDKAFPTPRSWYFCSKLISDIDSNNLETLNLLVSASVGEAVGMEFTSFLKLRKKIDIKKVLSNPEKCVLPKETDLLYSLVTTITENYKKNDKVLKSAITVALRLEPEFAILLGKLLKTANTKFKTDVLKIKQFNEYAKRYGKYIIE